MILKSSFVCFHEWVAIPSSFCRRRLCATFVLFSFFFLRVSFLLIGTIVATANIVCAPLSRIGLLSIGRHANLDHFFLLSFEWLRFPVELSRCLLRHLLYFFPAGSSGTLLGFFGFCAAAAPPKLPWLLRPHQFTKPLPAATRFDRMASHRVLHPRRRPRTLPTTTSYQNFADYCIAEKRQLRNGLCQGRPRTDVRPSVITPVPGG